MKVQSIRSAGYVICGIVAGILVKLFGLNIIWLVNGVGVLLNALILSFGAEYFQKHKVKIKDSFNHTFQQSKKGISYCVKHKILFYLTLALIFIGVSSGLIGLVYQPFLISVGVPVYLLGYLVSLVGLVSIGLPFLSKPLLKKTKNEKNYLILTSIAESIISLLAFFIYVPITAISWFVLGTIPSQIKNPIANKYPQHFIPNKLRATIISFRSMVWSIGSVIAMIIGGIIADAVGPRMTIVYSSIFIFLEIICYLLIKEKKQPLNIKKSTSMTRGD